MWDKTIEKKAVADTEDGRGQQGRPGWNWTSAAPTKGLVEELQSSFMVKNVFKIMDLIHV